MKGILTAVAALFIGLFTVFDSDARAATIGIDGGQTKVTVTAPLGALGLSGITFGTATVAVVNNLPVFTFPITGGKLNTTTGNALIEHDGSGVTLSDANGTTATVGNFLIKTKKKAVFGDLIDATTGNSLASGLKLFKFGAKTELPGVELLITKTLATALTGVFGAPNLKGAQFGYAVPEVAAVPVPAAGVLLLGGLGLLGALRARRNLVA
jgi:hypothetical protein